MKEREGGKKEKEKNLQRWCIVNSVLLVFHANSSYKNVLQEKTYKDATL